MTEQTISIRLKPIDWITLFFCSWMLLLIGVGWHYVQHPLTHFITYLSLVAGILVLLWTTEFFAGFTLQQCSNAVCRFARPRFYKLLIFVRHFYPVLLFLYFFESVSATNRVFFHQWLDPFFMQIDMSIWGYLPSMEWSLRFGSAWLDEWLHFAYFSYYLMIAGLPVLVYLKKRKAMDELVFVLSAVFYFCYFIYSWLPVIGGRFNALAMEWTRQMQGGIFTNLMAFIYIHSPHLGGAFPSSHIAISLVLSLLALKHFRLLGYVFLFLTSFLAIATVYCHYHWFIDAVFGILTGLLGYWAAQKVFKHYSE